MGTLILLDLMGGVALLLWGLHMVQSGILRAFGPDLRRALSKAFGNRFAAFAAGLGLTALLQSSTATGLMTASFAAEGIVGLVPALAIMLGANVGTTLIVQVLSFNVIAAAPVLFVIGLLAFRLGSGTRLKDVGRVLIGLGLMLLALHILIDSLAPAENAPSVYALFTALTGDAVLCVIIGAILTWAAHSSVAMVLLIMSLAYSQFVSADAALALVIGANLGSAVNPILEGGRRGDLASYRLPSGNLLNRLIGTIVVVPLLPGIAETMRGFEPNAAKMVAEFHIAFNVALAGIFIGLLDPIAALLVKVLPERRQASDPSAPRYLDDAALGSPSLALADAARETLHMGDIVESMLRQIMIALLNNDRALTSEVSRMDNGVDRLDDAIKLYVTKLTRDSLDDTEGRRAMEIISFTINLEHIGDIIDKNLCELATKKIKGKLQFSEEGAAELAAFHKRVLDNLKVAFAVFMNGNVADARKLIAAKAEMRSAEIAAAERHIERLREGRTASLETTSLHLDVLRDLKRIHSHICSVAYPVLEAAGEIPAAEALESDPLALSPAKPKGTSLS